MKRILFALTLLSNSMLLGMALLVYLDSRNPYMKFLTSGTSKIYILLMCLLGLTVGFLYLRNLWNRD